MSVELVCYVKTMTVLHENNVETIYRGSNLPEYYPFNETHLDGANLTRRFQPSASTRRARRSDAATFDQNKRIFFMLMPRT